MQVKTDDLKAEEEQKGMGAAFIQLWFCGGIVSGEVQPLSSRPVDWQFALFRFDSSVVGRWTESEAEVFAVTPLCGQSSFLEAAVTQQVNT